MTTKKKTPDRFDRREPRTLTAKVNTLCQLFKELDETVGIMVNAGQDEKHPVSRKEFEEFKLVVFQEINKKIAHQPLKAEEILAHVDRVRDETVSLLRTEFNQRLINAGKDLDKRFEGMTRLYRAEVNALSLHMTNLSSDLNERFQNLNRTLQKAKEKSESVTWNSADGPIVVQDMSDEHIVNTLRMILRRHSKKMLLLALGDGPVQLSQTYIAKVRAVLAEATKRKLNWKPVESPYAEPWL
jgi:hypothetical protein